MSCRRNRGFTLIELMIVVVVIGILAAIAIPNFIAMQNRAKEGTVKAEMHTFQLAVEDYAVQNNGKYPTTVSQVIPLLPLSKPQINPYTRVTMVYGSETPGNIQYTATDTSYVIGGWGIGGTDQPHKIALELTYRVTE